MSSRTVTATLSSVTITPSDFDLDIFMLVADREEGDVPPGIAGPGDVVFVNDTAIAGAPPRKSGGETTDKKMEAEELKKGAWTSTTASTKNG